ncbi:hypothetical protein D3C85_1162920 [compost metagenome]
MGDEVAEHALGHLEGHGGHHTGHDGIAPVHIGVRHGHIEEGEGQRREHHRHGADHQPHTHRHGSHVAHRHRNQVGTDRETGADQHRAQRQHGPEHEHPLRQRPAPLDAPDGVQRVFHGQHGQHRGHHQARQTQRGQPARALGELAEVARDRIADIAARNQVLEQEGLDLAPEVPEHRKCGQQRERHGQHRHHGQHGGEGQAGGYLGQAVLAGAAQGVARKRAHLLQIPLPAQAGDTCGGHAGASS